MSKNYWHNRGQSGKHERPYAGPPVVQEVAELIFGTPKGIRKARKSFDKGSGNRQRQKKSKDCFLTTACVEHAGLADDCHELQVLRRFRDDYVAALPDGKTILSEYYLSAPTIVRRIQSSRQRGEVLGALFGTIREAVVLIESGHHKQAFDTYATTFRNLKTQYGDA